MSQRQDSLNDQLRDIAAMAEREGCYDAADWIRLQLKLRAMVTPAMRQNAIDFMRGYRDEHGEAER